jgi:putative ABC transport system permease protein
MGRILLISRLAVRDLRHRPVEAVLVLLAITAASATLALGLVLRGVTAAPSYQQTRDATRGPDVVATGVPAGQLRAVTAQARAAGAATSRPYPVASVIMRAGGYTAGVTAEGRPAAPAALDRPAIIQGSWVSPGGVVVERSFAGALGISPGDHVTLNGHRFTVAGIAVTAASPPYPMTGFMSHNPALGNDPGLIWVTEAEARGLATPAQPLSYTLNAKTADAAQTRKLAGPNGFQGYWTSSQAISAQDAKELRNEQLVLTAGSWLLSLLAVASVAVLVGGRMAEQTRRVGLLKAAGGTPGLVTAVLLAEYLILAVAAAAAGLTTGRLAAPMLTNLSFFSGLITTPAAPPVTDTTITLVLAAALAVAVAATLVPAIRASRTSTVSALADSARPPRRHAGLTALSARLPVPLLLGLRLAARRPRRTLLNMTTVALTVTTLVAVLVYHAHTSQQMPGALAATGGPPADPVGQVMLVITAVLIILAAINAIFITWATVLDARHPSALARALGTTPGQLTTGLSAAQLLPAIPGAIIGIPAGIGLYAAVSNGGGLTIPPTSWITAATLGTLLALAALTAIPARLGARRPISGILQAETA